MLSKSLFWVWRGSIVMLIVLSLACSSSPGRIGQEAFPGPICEEGLAAVSAGPMQVTASLPSLLCPAPRNGAL